MKSEEDVRHILNHTQGVWAQLAGRTVFLTGGTGFFGKWILGSFLYANDRLLLRARIVVLSRDPDKFLRQHPEFRHECADYIRGDVRDFEFPQGPIDYIIHAATEASVALNLEQPLVMFDTIVEGTKRVLELARIKKVAAVLHTSSGAVYGKQPSDMTHVPEDFGGSPDIYGNGASYGEGKRVSEMLCHIYNDFYGVQSKIARCFAFVGPYLPLDTTYAIGNFINDALKGNKIIIKGDGTAYRSYLYASDLAIWLWNILVYGSSCRPYNVGSDHDLTMEELAAMVSSVSETKPGIEISMPKSNMPPARYVPEISRAKEELNLQVYIGLKEGIKKTIDFYS